MVLFPMLLEKQYINFHSHVDELLQAQNEVKLDFFCSSNVLEQQYMTVPSNSYRVL